MTAAAAAQVRRRLAQLDAPLTVARMWAGRSRRTAIAIRLSPRPDRTVATITAEFVGLDGRMQPGPSIALDPHKLPELARALERAHARAIELNLILAPRGQR